MACPEARRAHPTDPNGRELAELFDALDEDAVRFVPRADDPAAFLAKKLRELGE